MYSTRLSHIISFSFLAFLFLLPLVMVTKASEVFEFPKMLLVYAATIIICALWLMRMVVERRLIIARTPLDIPILLFLISQIVSTLFSVDPHTSWLGYYSRFHGGLLSTICYTLLYFAFVSNRRNEYLVSETIRGATQLQQQKGRNFSSRESERGDKRFSINSKICRAFSGTMVLVAPEIITIIISATLVSLYAILQHFGIDKNFWVQDVVNRVFSTQGQPNWLAAYLVMTIPLVFVMTARSKGFFSIFSYFLLLISFSAMLFTKSRSGLIGLAVADVVFWGLVFLKGRSSRGGPSFTRFFLIAHCFLFIALSIISNPLRDYILRSPAQGGLPPVASAGGGDRVR